MNQESMAIAAMTGTEYKQKGKIVQVVLGCGSTGYAIAKELKSRGKEVIIVDTDERKVELLKEEDFNTSIGDISNPELINKIRCAGGEPEVVFITSNNDEVNKKAVENVKKEFPTAYLVVRALNPADKEELKELGVDLVLFPPGITAHVAIEKLEEMKSRRIAEDLISLLEKINDREEKLGIVAHDNPDADAIASALALKHIAKNVGLTADILYRGEIGHHVNRAFVNILGIKMRRVEKEEELEEYDKIALVDSTVPGANNALPPSANVGIIIDHHTANSEGNGEGKEEAVEFWGVQKDTGATSTIMTKYLRELNVSIDKVLATALLYGIKSDTAGFKREVHTDDFTAAAFLHPKADKDLLDQIETPPMSTETLNVLSGAILHRKIKGSYLITNAGVITNRDALPQAADYLLNLEGITTVLVTGLYEENICISGRSKDIRVDIGDAFVTAFGKIGSAGGHATMAAAQIPLGIFSGIKDKNTLMQLAEDAVTKRFLTVMGEENSD